MTVFATPRRYAFGLFLAASIFGGRERVGVQQNQSSAPRMPFEDIGACPFEGCVYRDWVANSPVSVRTDRRSDAPIVFAIKPGERVQAMTGIVITVKPGRVQFRRPADLTANDATVHVEPGETLYLLTYHGEGVTTAWFKGRLYEELDGTEFINDKCRIVPGSCNGTILARPETIWWVRVRNQKRQTGWTNEPGKFDNKDRFGN